MVQYLKKKKLYLLGKSYIDTRFKDIVDIECLRNASYSFYRGSEWLSFHFNDFDSKIKIYNCKSYMRIVLFDYSEDECDYIKSFEAFFMPNEIKGFLEQISNF